MTLRPYFSPLPLIAASCVALAGCGFGQVGTATVAYQQVGACNGYGAVTGRPNQAYVIFKIEAVDNSQGNVNFLFIPTRLYVDQSTEKQKAEWVGGWKRQFVSENTKFLQDLGGAGITPKSVPHNSKAELNAFVFVPVNTVNANGAAEANQTSYKLSYDSQPVPGESDPAVVFNKTNAAQTTWPETESCQAIKL
ncbi:hypothetical protein RZS28_02730 [Methylocapsa polymorpha]|uniref:Lipoprotein n=1 Tax=Methylocapsa polymorpha TaxID=3080828 RepID=A0ABZ0HSG4_9HYPH|nr:hypothetical protein RZS28_02730 [Methylocapsa sp. RX1]